MRILIREIRRVAGDTFEHIDTTFDGDVLTIGRATDQVIQLQDRQLALSHSEILMTGRHLSIRAVGREQLFVNGKRTRASRIHPGDEFEIGAYRFTIRQAPPGYDFAITVQAGELSAQESAFGANFRQSLDETAVSKRKLSWVFASLVLVLFLGIPAIGLFDHDRAADLRATPWLPDDGLWSSGPMHNAHRFMGDNCNACHVVPFVMVRDQECIACHTSTTHHVDPAVHHMEYLEETRCATCHKEHKEPGVLVRRDQGLCGDCHGNLMATAASPVELYDASDFEHHHPEFRLSMLVPTGSAVDMEWEVVRRPVDDPGLVEQSNLKFPHDVHLDPGGIDGPDGVVRMVCGDCHRAEAGGAYMQPVTMESHCADCHLLTFDPGSPEREMPHGQPDMVVRLLEEFYSREFLWGPTVAPTARSIREARRPGQMTALTAAERAQAVERARQRALEVAETIFERTTCAICHEVERVDDPNRDSPWQVLPVQLQNVWMPKSWFDHASHRTMECVDCHAAETSSSATDVLMPDIASCRECHGGGHASNKLISECVDCHVFHLRDTGLMRPDEPGASLRPIFSDLDAIRGDRVYKMTPVKRP